MAATGLWGLSAISGTTQRALSQDVKLAETAAEIQNLILLARRFEKDTFINMADATRRDDYVKRWQANRAKMNTVLAEAERVFAQGVRVLKVKVGRDWEEDLARILLTMSRTQRAKLGREA